MLSSLPKLADKAFIIGFFLPALLFAVLFIVLFHDQTWAAAWLKAASRSDSWDKLAYFVLTIWVFALLLMMGNLLLTQILEGYYGPFSRIPCLKKSEERRRLNRQNDYNAIIDEWEKFGDAFPEARKREAVNMRSELRKEFPLKSAEQLPTRLGNAVRAFEAYSREVYGADSIPLWLHLSTVVPKEFQSALNDARAQVNFAINIVYCSAIFSLFAFVRCVLALDWSSFLHLGAAVVAVVISRIAYLFAIQLVYGWGDLVKAAFDCYLPALAEKLGYKLPDTSDERIKFWNAVSVQSIAWVPLLPEQWKLAEKTPSNADAHARNELRKNARTAALARPLR